MNRNQNFKTLDEKKKELASLRAEWEKMKEQEKQLKEKFYSSPFEARAKIKRELTSHQKEMFEKKWGCGKSMSIDVEHEEMIQRLENPTGPATDSHHLAEIIKKELRETLDGSRKFEVGDTVGDIWEANQSKEICYFGRDKKVNELIANLKRNRQKPLNRDRITTRLVRVKQEDFSAADFNEMISLIRQVKDFLEAKDKQERQNTENIKLNNPHLFTQWKCSSDKRNGVKKWENWHTFSGKHNGFNYTIYVPDNHIALTNCLFDDGWGTNSEVSKFFVVEGVAKPTELHYWNVAQRKDEIISEAEAQKLTEEDKDYRINYKTYVDVNDKITIRHYDEKSDKLELVKPVSGANKELDENNQQIMSGSSTNEIENPNPAKEIDTEFLLQYFKDHNIKQISLTPERELLIEYNDGRTKISEKTNNQELQKVISYCQKNSQISLSQQDLINLKETNSAEVKNPNNNKLLIGIGLGIGGTLIIGAVIGILVRRQKRKKQ